MNTKIGVIIVLLLLIQSLLMSCSALTEKKNSPKAKRGVIDLTSWNFHSKGSITLDGQWEFYWNKLAHPNDFKSRRSNKINYLTVPGQWIGKRINGKKIPGKGFATYRLKIRRNSDDTLMSLKLFYVLSAFKVWVNGKLVSVYGDVSATEYSKKQYVFPAYHLPKFTLDRNINEVVLQVLNYHNDSGGFLHSIELGTAEAIKKSNINRIIYVVLIAGCIFFIGIYNFFQYLFRKIDTTPLIFFFLTFNWFINTMVLHTPIMDHYGFNQKTIYIIDYITMTMNLPLFMMLMKKFFPDDCHRVAVRISQIISFIVLFSLIFTNYQQSKLIILGFFAVNVLYIIYGIYLLTRALYLKRNDAVILFVGILLYMISGFNDMFYEARIIETKLLSHYGLFILCISMSVVISLRFSRAFSKVEQLSIELENKNIELTRIDKLKDDFLANTSHELKTPLHGIIGLSESIIEQTSNLPENVRKDISLISLSGHRLSNLVNDILDFSRMKHEELELHIKPIDLYTITGLVIKLSEVQIGHKNIEIINLIPENIPAALGDEDRIKQIMHNLIGNAVKFTIQGTIKISATVVDSDDSVSDKDEGPSIPMVEIRVSDTGVGIPEQYIDSIFDSFQQVDGTDSRIHEGTGLGLAITKKLIELHKGNIRVMSELHKGSIFIFSLPLSQDQYIRDANFNIKSELRKSSPLVENKAPVQSESIDIEFDHYTVILIVDDDPVNIKILKNYLDSRNCKFLTAMNGLEALDIIATEETVDLVLLDIMMPLISGYEVCRRIREVYDPEVLPIILLTSKSQLSDVNAGFEAGANDYIIKPFQIRELLIRINTILRLKNINRDINTGIKLSERGTSYFFIFDEIVYITIKSRSFIIHTIKQDIEISGFYKDLKVDLPSDRFIRVHKQYVINIKHVLNLSHVISGRYKVVLKDFDDTELPVGRSFLEQVREKL